MKKRVVAALLAGTMVLSLTACGSGSSNKKSGKDDGKKDEVQTGIEISADQQGPPPEDAPVGGQVVVGINPGTLSPDMKGGWAANMTNSGFMGLMGGYYLTTTNRDRVTIWDPVVVKEHEVTENEDGSKTYRVVINDNLKWSDGTPITAKDYIGGIMMNSSPEYAACEADATGGWAVVGFDEYNSGETEVFSGLRILGDYEFSVQITADELPNYYELVNVGFGPEPMAAIAPGVEIKDDGEGAYFSDEYTADLLRKTLLDPETGFRYKNPVVCGPYKLKDIDLTTETVELEINKEYLGSYDGTKPHIASIISKPVANETIRDEFEKGTIDWYSAGSGEKVEAALDKMESGEWKVNYGLVPGSSMNEIRFVCDFGPTQFEEVRRAIGYIVDREELNKQLTGGYSSIIDGFTTEASGDYQATKDRLEKELTHYSFNIDKAKQELIDGGWTLNEKGEEYKEGVDKYRYKEVDGELMELKIEVACGDDDWSKYYNTVIPPEAEKIGINYKYTAMDFALMINHMNREGVDPTYNIFYCSFGIPEITYYWYFFGDDPQMMGLWNVNRIADPEIKEASAKMQKVEPEDTEGFRDLYVEFQKVYNKKLPSLPINSGISYMFFNPRLKNFVPRAYDGWSGMILDAYIEEADQ